MEPAKRTVSVVLVGSFDPAKFLPRLLQANKIISRQETETADLLAFLPDSLLHFQLEWANVLVNKNRLQIEVTKNPYVRAADFVLSCVNGEKDAKFKSLGINLEVEFTMTTAQRDRLGMTLAPPSAWGSWGREIEKAKSDKVKDAADSGMALVLMRQTRSDDREVGYIDVRIEPTILAEKSAVKLRVNDHYQIAPLNGLKTQNEVDNAIKRMKEREPGSSQLLLARLVENFDMSVERSYRIAQEIVGAANG